MEGQSIISRPARQKRILIVDDHPLMQTGLAAVLSRNRNYLVCGEAEDHHEALEKIKGLKPDLATVDLTLRNSFGLELIKDIHVQFPALLVLVVSVHDEFLNARRVISAGAHGYISKLEPLTQVLTAIERIFAGEVYVSHRVVSQMALQMAGRVRIDNDSAIHNLTDRELQIFEMIGDGLGVRQIANRLNLGISTVETYRSRIREKLCLTDSSELLQAAIGWNRSGSLNGKPAMQKSQIP
jgi:DNA-binding NarL/FixJ family response regulator